MIGDVFVLDDDAAAVGRFQSEHVPQRDRLAAARSAEDDQDFAAVDLEVGAAQHLLVAVRLVDVAELDEEIARMAPPVRRVARLGAAVGSDGRCQSSEEEEEELSEKEVQDQNGDRRGDDGRRRRAADAVRAAGGAAGRCSRR